MENCGNTLNFDGDLDEVERLEERSHHIHTFEKDFLLLLRAGPHEAKEIVHRHLHLVDSLDSRFQGDSHRHSARARQTDCSAVRYADEIFMWLPALVF